jgi:hypothetical protein
MQNVINVNIPKKVNQPRAILPKKLYARKEVPAFPVHITLIPYIAPLLEPVVADCDTY